MKVKALLLALLSGFVLNATAQEFNPKLGLAQKKAIRPISKRIKLEIIGLFL